MSGVAETALGHGVLTPRDLGSQHTTGGSGDAQTAVPPGKRTANQAGVEGHRGRDGQTRSFSAAELPAHHAQPPGSRLVSEWLGCCGARPSSRNWGEEGGDPPSSPGLPSGLCGGSYGLPGSRSDQQGADTEEKREGARKCLGVTVGWKGAPKTPRAHSGMEGLGKVPLGPGCPRPGLPEALLVSPLPCGAVRMGQWQC